MPVQIIPVNESENQTYDFPPGVRARNFKALYLDSPASIRVKDRIIGWGQWEFLIEVSFASAYGPSSQLYFLGRTRETDRWPSEVNQQISAISSPL